jgi:membrane protein YdbS with pleckstrin-like domain
MASWRGIYPLESIKPLKKTISRAILYIFILLFAYIFVWVWSHEEASSPGAAEFFRAISPFFIFIIFLIAVVLTYIYQFYYMEYYSYDMKEKSLIIKKGVFSRNEITLPVNRLQDVYVDQDILDRIFGLYDVHVSSATIASGYLSHIDGVNKINSEKIKELILGAVHKKNGKK